MQDFNVEALPFYAAGKLKRSVDQLIGICSGLVADGEINDSEVVTLPLDYLNGWLFGIDTNRGNVGWQ